MLSRYPKILNIIIGAEEQYLENDMQFQNIFFENGWCMNQVFTSTQVPIMEKAELGTCE